MYYENILLSIYNVFIELVISNVYKNGGFCRDMLDKFRLGYDVLC